MVNRLLANMEGRLLAEGNKIEPSKKSKNYHYVNKEREEIKSIINSTNEHVINAHNERYKTQDRLRKIKIYIEIKEAQGGLCEICGKPLGQKRKLNHIDHCHKTGKIRGLLCIKCNLGLGFFKDNPQSLIKAAKYLIKHDWTKAIDDVFEVVE